MGVRLTRRVREEPPPGELARVYFDRNATQNGAKRSGSAGMDRRPSPHRENWAAWVSSPAAWVWSSRPDNPPFRRNEVFFEEAPGDRRSFPSWTGCWPDHGCSGRHAAREHLPLRSLKFDRAHRYRGHPSQLGAPRLRLQEVLESLPDYSNAGGETKGLRGHFQKPSGAAPRFQKNPFSGIARQGQGQRRCPAATPDVEVGTPFGQNCPQQKCLSKVVARQILGRAKSHDARPPPGAHHFKQLPELFKHRNRKRRLDARKRVAQRAGGRNRRSFDHFPADGFRSEPLLPRLPFTTTCPAFASAARRSMIRMVTACCPIEIRLFANQ